MLIFYVYMRACVRLVTIITKERIIIIIVLWIK